MAFKIGVSKDGFNVVTINNNQKDYLIGDLDNQKSQVSNFIKNIGELTDRDIYIIFGLGFTEHILELIKQNKNFKSMLLVEFDKEFFSFLKENNHLEKLMGDKRISFATDIHMIKDFFNNSINDFNIENIKFAYYTNIDKAYEKELDDVAKLVNDLSYDILNNRNANLRFSDEWLDTLLENLKYMKDSLPVNFYKDKYKDIPAVIVSAGPSLSKNINELKNLDSGIIISGGRTLNTLLDNKIEPSFLACVDSGWVAHQHVEDVIESIDIPLIYYNGTNKDIVSRHKAEKIFYTDNEFIKSIFEIDIPHLGGRGSVAHLSTNFAVYAGCNPIIFIGQDLAYTDDKLHDENALNKTYKYNDADKNITDIIVEDINGQSIRTSPILNGFRLELEKIISQNKNTKFINATEGGAKINGAEQMKLKDVISYLKVEKIMRGNYKKVDKELLIDNLEDYKKLLIVINNRCKEAVTLIEKIEKSLGKPKVFATSTKKLESTEIYIKSNLDNLSIIKNKMFEIMYEASNLDEYKVKSTDTRAEYVRKNFRKNKKIYISFIKVLTDTNKKISTVLEVWKNS